MPGRSDDTRIESPAARVRTPARRPPPPLPRSDRPEDRVGQILGSYRLVELIGKGGMGFVYRAEHVRLGREVALKLLRADYARRRDAVSRFFQEARTVNRIRHRNIVDVTDFVELDDGTTYIIMELLRGHSLGSWARRAGSLDLPRVLALLIQICDGLAAAHAVGIIHRDLKPDNIVIVPTPDGAEQVKLLDFGVAKLLNREDEDIGLETAAGSVIGTPAYMSPEQAGGMVVDHRADLYSLGAIMYELFCGQPLFRGRSFGEYVRKHLNETPVPPRETAGGGNIDPRIEAVLLRCLEKDPGDRYPSVAHLRDELLHLLGGIETHEHTLDPDRPVRLPRVLPLTPPPDSSPGRAMIHTVPPPGPDTLARLGLGEAVDPGRVAYPGSTPPPSGAPAVLPFPGRDSGRAPPITTPAAGQVSYAGTGSHPGLGSQPGAQLVALPAASPPRRAWPYALGAVVTAGAAVIAVVAVANRAPGAPPPAPAPPPRAPAITPLSTVATGGGDRATVVVRIDAPTGAEVVPVGTDLVTCRVPCAFVIDPTDGGSTSHRDYVVRLAGFHDHHLGVDLAEPPEPLRLDLVPIEPPRRGRERRRDRDRPPADTRPADTGPADTRPADTSTDTSTDARPADTRPADTRPADTRPRDRSVDPTATIDPFAPRSGSGAR